MCNHMHHVLRCMEIQKGHLTKCLRFFNILNNDHIWQLSWSKFTMHNLCEQPLHCHMWEAILEMHLFKWASKCDIDTRNNNVPQFGVVVDVIDFDLNFKLGCASEATTDVQKENYVWKVYWECSWMYYRCTEMTKWKCLRQAYQRTDLGATVSRRWRNFERSSLILTTQCSLLDLPQKQTKWIDNSIQTKRNQLNSVLGCSTLSKVPFTLPDTDLDVNVTGFCHTLSALMRTEQETEKWEINNKSINGIRLWMTKFENLWL